MTLLVAGIHFAIQSSFIYYATDTNISEIEELIKEVEEYDEQGKVDMSELEAEGIEQFKSFLTKKNIIKV